MELQLGIPTANIPVDGLEVLNEIGNGIYFGFAGVDIDAQGRRVPPVIGEIEASGDKKQEQERGRVWPMVMSIGLNPFYKNEVRSVVRYVPSPFGPLARGLCGLHTAKTGSSSHNPATNRERLLRRPNKLSSARVH